jgi:hypothetical protein
MAELKAVETRPPRRRRPSLSISITRLRRRRRKIYRIRRGGRSRGESLVGPPISASGGTALPSTSTSPGRLPSPLQLGEFLDGGVEIPLPAFRPLGFNEPRDGRVRLPLDLQKVEPVKKNTSGLQECPSCPACQSQGTGGGLSPLPSWASRTR